MSFLFIFYTNLVFAVGWEEILPDNLEKKGVFVNSEFFEFSNCWSFEIKLPLNLFFDELGEREFWSARFVAISNGKVTFPLRGTTIHLKSTMHSNHYLVKGVCVNNEDIDRAYISATYGGPQGTVPMVVYFRLKGLD